jgi:hypothetical protein
MYLRWCLSAGSTPDFTFHNPFFSFRNITVFTNAASCAGWVGDSGSAVLRTIHGDRGAGVRERVVTDLGVPESSFAATDLIVTLRPPDDGADRRVAAVEEVIDGDDGVRFAPLFETADGDLSATGRIDRGNSRLVADLAAAGESYADVRTELEDRTGQFRNGAVAARSGADRARASVRPIRPRES